MIGLVAVTAAGRPLAEELHAAWPDGSVVVPAGRDADGDPREILDLALGGCRRLVCFAPVGLVVRLLLDAAPGLSERPAVVCVDLERRFTVSLTGGPGGAGGGADGGAAADGGAGSDGGADELAGEVAAVLGIWPVVTDGPAADPLADATEAPGRPTAFPARPGGLPPLPRRRDLVIGIGARQATEPPEVARLIRRTLLEAGLSSRSVARLATLDGKGDHPAVRWASARMGLPVDEHPADTLAAVAVPNPSAAVGNAVGTMSVAEAAALASAPGGELVVAKRKSATATVAVARAAVRGRLAVVGLGPGEHDLLVPRALAELRRATVVVGEPGAVERIAGLLRPGTRRSAVPDGCAELAVALASQRQAVALVALGDGASYAPPPGPYELHRVPGLPLPPPPPVPPVGDLS
ncbi:cobalamin biosynthesis protein [Kitasatospora sp. NPDC087315]|uniref:cobalamin biosynthesis protein n=1 Tax=Kitasatospora sp. NPDC087315 TaxID=3364069 RepID=UPI0038298893